MPELSDFSIESDRRVHLKFRDGTKNRVAAEDLPRYIAGNDLTRVRRALHMRQNYITRMLPPWARIVLVGVGTAALVWLQSGPVASWRAIQPVKANPESHKLPGQSSAPNQPVSMGRKALEPSTEPAKSHATSSDELNNLIKSASDSVDRFMNPGGSRGQDQARVAPLKGRKK